MLSMKNPILLELNLMLFSQPQEEIPLLHTKLAQLVQLLIVNKFSLQIRHKFMEIMELPKDPQIFGLMCNRILLLILLIPIKFQSSH